MDEFPRFPIAPGIFGIAILLGLACNWLVFGYPLGAGFFLFVILVLLGLLCVRLASGKRIPNAVVLLIPPLLFFSAMMFVRESSLLTALNFLACAGLLLLMTDFMAGRTVQELLLRNSVRLILLPFKFLRPMIQTIASIFSFRGIMKNRQHTLSVLRGVLMALPVLVVFIVLFASADLVFQDYVKGIVNFQLEIETSQRLTMIVIVSLALTGAFAYSTRSVTPREEKPAGMRIALARTEMGIFLGSINLLFLLFILIQIRYLFGGADHVSVQGFTYAEYARRGFFELMGVGIVSFALLWVTDKSVEHREHAGQRLARILSGVLILQVIVIMISAFKRLALYEQAYGFTTLRLFSHVFIIFLGVIFLLLAYKIFINRKEHAFTALLYIALVLFLAGLNLLNPDAFIAKKNLERFAASGKIDVYYLSRLSADALPQTVTVLDSEQSDLRRGFASLLKSRSASASFSDGHWQSFHFSRRNAKKLLTPKKELLDQDNSVDWNELLQMYQ